MGGEGLGVPGCGLLEEVLVDPVAGGGDPADSDQAQVRREVAELGSPSTRELGPDHEHVLEAPALPVHGLEARGSTPLVTAGPLLPDLEGRGDQEELADALGVVAIDSALAVTVVVGSRCVGEALVADLDRHVGFAFELGLGSVHPALAALADLAA